MKQNVFTGQTRPRKGNLFKVNNNFICQYLVKGVYLAKSAPVRDFMIIS